jgi:hypothetical protein
MFEPKHDITMKAFVLILSFILCSSLSAQKGKIYLSNWHENGNAEMNLPSDKFSYFEKGKFYYFLSNDNNNIYIDIKIEDAGVQNRILKEGLIVWINMDGKSTKKMGVRYPIGSQNSGIRGGSNMPEIRLNSSGSLATPISQANTIELIGFTNEEKRRFPSNNTDSFSGSIKYDNEGILHYKMIMPVTKLPVINSKEGDGILPFTFGFEYGGIVDQRKGPGGSPIASPSSDVSGSRGGSRGGGRSGGGMSGGSGQVRSSTTTQPEKPSVQLWVKNIKLATDK